IATTEAAVDVLDRLRAGYPSVFGRPRNSRDSMAIFRSGRIISPLGLEGLHLIGDSFTKLRDYHARGVRYATLTHNCHNAYADAALAEVPGFGLAPAKPRWFGVSAAGHRLVREMNRLGIMVDLSHTSADTMRDVLGHPKKAQSEDERPWEGSLAPPIFSHSNAFELCPHPRNVPDDVLRLVAARRGIVMVTFTPEFVSCFWPGNKPIHGDLPERYGPNLTVSQVVRHMRHIGDLIGYDYVGMGSDFDGVASTLPGLEDVSRFPDLVAEMLKQGIRDSDAEKIVGGNLLRVWNEVDAVAARMQADGEKPAEDDLPVLGNPWE
ncbi:Dipeptidase sirJ, partial [Colletotrichum shisoi]